MEKFKKYYGVIAFTVSALGFVLLAYYLINPMIGDLHKSEDSLDKQQKALETKQRERDFVANKLKKLKDSVATAPKRVYAPVESDLGNDTLFFTMYNDLLEMVHANSVKIRSLDYSYNPSGDKFVEQGQDVYFVCDVNMELVTNYVNLGKLIQDIYQYPYYIKINELNIKPYEKDKKILITNLGLRLYAHTTPQDEIAVEENNENTELE